VLATTGPATTGPATTGPATTGLATTGLATTGLAATAGAGPPHLVPVTFALDGDHIYTAVDSKPKSTRDLRRLRNIRANTRVSLLADHYDEDWSQLWWVRADGQAAILAGPAEMAGPAGLLARRYPQYAGEPPAGPVISIAVTRWSGWAAAGGTQRGRP
jgi:PPOX class probable F420-dependent enzyme